MDAIPESRKISKFRYFRAWYTEWGERPPPVESRDGRAIIPGRTEFGQIGHNFPGDSPSVEMAPPRKIPRGKCQRAPLAESREVF